MSGLSELIAKLEPAAWRFRYLPDGKWTVQKNKPTWYHPSMVDVALEPLFTMSALSALRSLEGRDE